MTVTYTKIYQDTTTLPSAAAASQFNVSNTIPSGLVESFIIQYNGTANAGGAFNSTLTTCINNLRVVFNGDQWFNFNSPVDVQAAGGNSRLGSALNDMGGIVAENASLTATDCSIVIPCGINLPPNSRFELDMTYFALTAATTLTGNFSIWCKYGASSNATIVGNATSFPVPEASQTMMTVAIPSYKGAKVSGIILQGPGAVDNLDTCIVQALGMFAMTPTYIRGASGASQNGYQYLDMGTDALGNVASSFTSGYYFIPLYDLDSSTASVNLLITTAANLQGTENYTATPVLKLPTGGRGENTPTQTASKATGSAASILQRAEE
jgi:hypothetical protein|tara:strand:- start:806 stop:1777 length:972 start_codon:yes stop_codon:yes gene_type:complete